MNRLLVFPILVLAAVSYSKTAEALIQIKRCQSYIITIPEQDGSFSQKTGTYCWLEFSLGPSEPPYQPPEPNDPGVPNLTQCYLTVSNWPDDCSLEDKPIVLADGCDIIEDNIGPVGLTASCNAHDMCYSTFGRSKSSCDTDVGVSMNGACNVYYGPKHWRAINQGNDAEADALLEGWNECIEQTDSFAATLGSVPGWPWYSRAQKVGGCVRAHEQRDQYCGY